MKILLHIAILIFTFAPRLYSQNREYDELAILTSPFESKDLQKPTNSRVTIDSIVQISEGINIEVALFKEESHWDNGNLKFTRFYQNNAPYGTWEYYTSTGFLKYTLTNYADYFTIQLHYENNNIRCIRKYNFETRTEITNCEEENYFPDGSMQGYGNKTSKLIINHWELVESGKWRYFFSNGTLESIGKFNNGDKEGKWNYYNKFGKKIRSVVFHNGLLISQKEY